jgi:hypothetical protein
MERMRIMRKVLLAFSITWCLALVGVARAQAPEAAPPPAAAAAAPAPAAAPAAMGALGYPEFVLKPEPVLAD